MRKLLAILPLIALPAAAQEVGSSKPQLSWGAGGALRVELTFTLPNGCYDAGTPELSPPGGQAEIVHAPALTIPITVRGDICSQALKDVQVRATIPAVPEDSVALIIYEQWPSSQGNRGQEIRAQAHPLPAR